MYRLRAKTIDFSYVAKAAVEKPTAPKEWHRPTPNEVSYNAITRARGACSGSKPLDCCRELPEFVDAR